MQVARDRPGRPRARRRHAAGDRHRQRRVAGGRRLVDGDADQHPEGALRGDPDRAQPVGDGRARAGRGHRPARRRRHRGRAAVQHRGVRLGQQPEVVLDRRPQGQLGRRRRRRHDDVLRLRDVRGIQHADGLGHRRERCLRRLHEHGHQVGRQPLHQRPQLLLHERRAAGHQHRRRPAGAARPASRASRAAPPATRSTSATTGARRWAGQSCATRPGSSARSAGGGSTSSRSARSTPTARRPSTTTASATSSARSRGRRRRASARRSCSTRTSTTGSTAATRRISSSRTRRRCCRTSRRRTTSPSTTTWSARGWWSTARFGRMWGIFPVRYQADVQPTDIAIRDVVRFTRINAAETQSLNPNGRYQGNLDRQLLLRLGQGRHPRPQGRPPAVVGGGASTSASATATCSWSCRTARRSRPSSPTRRSTPTIGCGPGACSSRIAGCSAAPRSTPACGSTPSAPPAGADQPGRHVRRGAQLPEGRRLRLRAERRAPARHLLRPVRQRPHRGEGLLRPLLQPVRIADRRSRQSQRAGQPGGVVDRQQRQPHARRRRARHLHRVPARPVPDRGRRREPALQPRVQRRRVAGTGRQHGGVGQLPPPAAPQRPGHPRPRPRPPRPTRRSRAPTSTRERARRSRSPSTTCGRSSSPPATASSTTSTS